MGQPPTETTRPLDLLRAAERWALTLSLRSSIAVATAAIVVGVASGTRVIVFDGAYVAVGLLLTWISLRASALAAAGPSSRFPFGRDAVAPLVVVIQGLAIAGALIAAGADAIIVIRDGGNPVNAWIIAGYGTLTAALGFLVSIWLPRIARRSDLVAAEAAQWRAGSVLSAIMIVGAAAVPVLHASSLTAGAHYVDPILVLTACLLLAPVPTRLVRTGINELLEGAPSATLGHEIATAVETVRAQFQLPTPIVRAGKVGQKVYVEVDFVIGPTDYNVHDEDQVRRAVLAQLQHLGLDTWAYVSLTGDPTLVE